MMKMTNEIKKQLYELTKADIIEPSRFESNDLMTAISFIWDVYRMKNTEDERYNNLGDEIEKHFFLNNDWNPDKLFVGKLKIFDDNSKFISFIEKILNLYMGSIYYSKYKEEIEPILSKINIQIYTDTENGQTIVTLKSVDKENSNEIVDKGLKFYVCKSNVCNVVQFWETEIEWPDDDPHCFVLTFNTGWNDFAYYTRYRLYYINNEDKNLIGEVKIMKQNADDTSTAIPSSFYSLDSDFCSLGQSEDYYKNFFKYFKEKADVYLSRICDAALYSRIHKNFEKNSIFTTSLIRYNEAERALRIGRYIVYGRDVEKAFSFQYEFTPPYNKAKENKVQFVFDFARETESHKRTIALIGENGVGKSSIMREMVNDIVTNNNEHFISLNPLFSCVMAITYSPFDVYPLPNSFKDCVIDYEYCGLIDQEENGEFIKNLLTKEKQTNIFIKNVKIILKRQYDIQLAWKENVSKIINSDTLKRAVDTGGDEYKIIDETNLKKIFENASSGESIFLSVISAILAKIRFDSILFLDEPEQHLHPAGITVLISSILEILTKFNSFAIISTHSPFVIREIPSSNVRILHRKDDYLYSSKIGIESFGEDVSTISNVVFEDLIREKHYENIITKLTEENDYDFNRIVEVLQDGDKSLGLNTLLFINSEIRKKKNKQ